MIFGVDDFVFCTANEILYLRNYKEVIEVKHENKLKYMGLSNANSAEGISGFIQQSQF